MPRLFYCSAITISLGFAALAAGQDLPNLEPTLPGEKPANRVNQLIEQLAGKDRLQSQAAARSLGVMGEEAIPALVAAAKEQNPQTLTAAIAEMNATQIPQLATALRQDKHEAVRQMLARGMGQMGPVAAPAIIELAGDDDKWLRLAALEALDEMTKRPEVPVPNTVLPTLIAALQDQEQLVRSFAATSLGRIGPRTEELAPALVRSLLEDMDARVRMACARSLGQIARQGQPQPPVKTALIEAVRQDEEPTVRAAAIAALAALRQPEEATVEIVSAALTDPYASVREAAAQAVYDFGPAAAGSVPQLAEMIGTDTHDRARWYATGALGRMGEAAAPAVEVLAAALSDQDANVKAAASQALMRLGPTAEPALTALIAALEDDQDIVRQNAATTLGSFGAKAQPARETLESLSEDPSPRVQQAAQTALQRIGQP